MTISDVYITGMCLVAPSGFGGAEFIGGLSERDANFVQWPEDQHPPRPDAMLGMSTVYPVEKYFTERQLRLADRAMAMAMCAVGSALEDAGIDEIDCADDVATIFGSMRSEHTSTQRFSVPFLMGKPKSLNAAQFPMIARNVACGQVAMNLGLRGMSSMECSGPLASLNAIARGYDMVRRGRAPIAIVGGVETLSKFSINQSRHLYRQYLQGERPVFFAGEGGTLVASEGCSMLIIESAEHAQKRNAKPYARIVAATSGRLGRDQDGASAADLLTRLIDDGGDARQAWRNIDFISASNSGCATAASLVELEMIRSIYRKHDVAPPVTAARSWIGEAESVASSLQVQLAANALRTRSIPATRSAAADAGVGVNVVRQALDIKAGNALVSGFDEARNYAFLRLAQVDQ